MIIDVLAEFAGNLFIAGGVGIVLFAASPIGREKP